MIPHQYAYKNGVAICAQATVTMYNWQQYRHITAPGWRLSWAWAKQEIIWTMLGAQTTFQGDCSAIRADPLPHCCDRKPVVIDLLPSADQSLKVANCCTGGVLPSFSQDPDHALSSFQITVGKAGTSNTSVELPRTFALSTPMGSGYTCGPAVKVKKSLFPSADGRRFTAAMSECSSLFVHRILFRGPTGVSCSLPS